MERTTDSITIGMFSGRLLDIGFYYYAVVPGMLLAAMGMCTFPPTPTLIHPNLLYEPQLTPCHQS